MNVQKTQAFVIAAFVVAAFVIASRRRSNPAFSNSTQDGMLKLAS